MATIVEDFKETKEIIVFSGSSESDMAYAKTFWQSVHLFPPPESRLVSSDVRQRLKKAPPGNQKQSRCTCAWDDGVYHQGFGIVDCYSVIRQIKNYPEQAFYKSF